MRSVTIVGAGPAGLTAARVLAEAGLTDVLVLEREAAAGGLPRFCDHPGWGMLDLHGLYSGPRYARELTARATGAEIRTGATVLALEGTRLRLSTQQGPETLESRVVLLATGIRETPRGPRLISGTRPWGVTTTGAFQALAQAGLPPFRRPVIIGSELVAFSAILTARAAGIRPAALIEAAPRIVCAAAGRPDRPPRFAGPGADRHPAAADRGRRPGGGCGGWSTMASSGGLSATAWSLLAGSSRKPMSPGAPG